jgi:hypothetical protein
MIGWAGHSPIYAFQLDIVNLWALLDHRDTELRKTTTIQKNFLKNACRQRCNIPRYVDELYSEFLPSSCPEAEDQCYSCHVRRTRRRMLLSDSNIEYIRFFVTGLLDMAFQGFAVGISCRLTVVLVRGAGTFFTDSSAPDRDSSKRRMVNLSHQSIICSPHSIHRCETVGTNASIYMSVRGANISSFRFAQKMPYRLDVLQHLPIMIKMSSMSSCINHSMLPGKAELY